MPTVATWMRVALVCLNCVACSKPDAVPAPRQPASTMTAEPTVTTNLTRTDSLEREISRLQRDAAEKDSALELVRVTQDLLDNIDRELSAIPGIEERRLAVGGRDNIAADVDVAAGIARKIGRARDLVDQSSAAVRRLQRQLGQAIAKHDSLSEKDRQSLVAMATMVAFVERQGRELLAANERIARLENDNRELTKRVATITDTVSALRTREQVAYVAIGTEKELIDARVIVKRGGANLLLWKPGQTLQPATDPPKSAFRILDIRRDLVVTLPPGGAGYQIVSNHHLAFLSSPTDGDLVRHRVEIRDPEKFWEHSKFLILVRQ